ncbi:MAG: hypothetical protein Q4G26_15935 [Paracoccus sp. (in: a-proteobacteria)]|nr:hypothetical protein [Paracoccus sp. (in: a-proteobacteria)]
MKAKKILPICEKSRKGQQMTDAELLAQAGEALFGARWKTDLANALDVSDRTVDYWVAGDRSPRPGVWRDLAKLLRDNAVATASAADLIQRERLTTE